MNPLMRLSLLLICVLAACTATEPANVIPSPTVTRFVPTETTLPPTAVVADTPLARGRMVFNSFIPEVGFSCATCHYTTSERRLIGPGLMNVLQRASMYNPEMDADTYLRSAIVAPDAFITPADPPFPSGVMPKNYAQILTPEQLEDLLAYLNSL